MPSRLVLASVASLLMLAGCSAPAVGPPGAGGGGHDTPSSMAPSSTLHAGTPAAPLGQGQNQTGPTRSVEMAYQGKAGEWVVAFHPVRAGVNRATGQWNASLWVAGEGVHLYAGPDFVGIGESGLDALQNVHAGHGRLGLAWSWNGYREVSEGISGLLFVFGAEDDWTAHYRFELEEADLFPPSVARGTGFVGKVGAHAGGAAGARQLELEATFAEPGWTHVGAITYALQPVGLREMSVTFADGTAWNSTGYSAGAWTPVSENQVTSQFQDQHGHPRDAAGRVRATATTLEAAVETDLAIARFPFSDGIAGLTLSPYHATGGQHRIDPT